MTVIVKHNKTNTITDWTQAQLDEQIALGNFPSGTTLANIVLPSDWNNDHTLTGLGTMAEQDATAVAITGGTINNTTIGATTATTGKFTSVTTPSVTATTTNLNLYSASTGNVIVNQSSGGAFGLTLAQDISTPTNSARLFFDSNVNVASIRNNAGGGLAISTGATIGSTSGAIQFQVAPTASAVNYVQVTGGATGNRPAISAQGSDNPISLDINAKGSAGTVRIGNALSTAFGIFQGVSGQTVVNYPTFIAGQTTNAIQTQATGTDTNISMAFQPKGTGAIDLAAGSSGVNISNGGTVTAITRTAGGSGYATAPTVAISAPTTAGGVQATATCTVTAGAVNTTFTITNAGSGYIEQPTITFSGGGGSGAAAYATVGSATTLRHIGGFHSFTGPSGISFAINNASGTVANYVQASSQSTGNYPNIAAAGTDAAVGLDIFSKGATPVRTRTGTGGATQFQVSDTASAVNYVQVTGATTLNPPVISAQGSDTTVALLFQAKGGQNLRFYSNAGSAEQFRITHTAGTIANYCSVTGNVANSAPAFSVGGSDTDIDIALTPKGAGNVRFGTYTAGVLTPTGYVTIKTSDGTSRRLLVG